MHCIHLYFLHAVARIVAITGVIDSVFFCQWWLNQSKNPSSLLGVPEKNLEHNFVLPVLRAMHYNASPQYNILVPVKLKQDLNFDCISKYSGIL